MMSNQCVEKRSEIRALTGAGSSLVLGIDSYTCLLENLSPSGACVYIRFPLNHGVEVSLEVAGTIRAAVVIHCGTCDEGFLIGMQFVGEKWPELINLPVHRIAIPETAGRQEALDEAIARQRRAVVEVGRQANIGRKSQRNR